MPIPTKTCPGPVDGMVGAVVVVAMVGVGVDTDPAAALPIVIVCEQEDGLVVFPESSVRIAVAV